MSLKNSLLALLALSMGALVLTGCASKPKLDLSGVRNNPNATRNAGKAGGNGNSFNADSNFVEGPLDDGNGAGGNGSSASMGQWGSTDAPVAGTEDGNGFLKNAARWEECAVYFGYDQSELPPQERAKVDSLAKYLTDNPGQGVIIEGHADERGSDEYNRALGERRALAVQDYLSTMGVDASRMQTISYGEDRPAKANAQTDEDFMLNRRAEFVLGDLL